jgi:hypothetical protein
MMDVVAKGAKTQVRDRRGKLAGLPCALIVNVALAASLLLPGARAGEWGDAVIGFDIGRLNADGLQGPPSGLRALDYEYCIPADESAVAEVAAIDPSSRFMPGSRGRIGCGEGQTLVLGNTHQPGFRAILESLAALPYATRIVEAHFE